MFNTNQVSEQNVVRNTGRYTSMDQDNCPEHQAAVTATLAEARLRFQKAGPTLSGLSAWNSRISLIKLAAF